MKIQWKDITRRCVMVALCVTCLAILTGCDDDDSSSPAEWDGKLPGTTWDIDSTTWISFSSDGETARFVDTSDDTDLTGMYEDWNGLIWAEFYWGSMSHLWLDGEYNSSGAMTGDYYYEDEYSGASDIGTFTATKR